MEGPEFQQSQTITPSISKILYKNLMSVGAGTIIVTVILIVLYFSIGFEPFLVPLELLGMEPHPFEALVYIILAVMIVAAIAVGINYYSARQIRYEFFLDRVIIHRPTMAFFKEDFTVPYQNLARITYDFDGIFDMILKTGTITLTLTGMDREKVQLESLENVEAMVQQIQMLLGQFMAEIQQKKAENRQIQDIIDRV